MTHLSKRIDRLEAQRGGCAVAGSSVIILCAGDTGEPMTAMLKDGETLTREDGETAEAFTARAEADAAGGVFLPDNGRDALASGKAPGWASGALVDKALREKHAPK